jgi:hypothetical protein
MKITITLPIASFSNSEKSPAVLLFLFAKLKASSVPANGSRTGSNSMPENTNIPKTVAQRNIFLIRNILFF